MIEIIVYTGVGIFFALFIVFIYSLFLLSKISDHVDISNIKER